MRLRPPAVLLAAVALAGCGDDGPTDEERIRTTLQEFQRATAEQDYAKLCDEVLGPELVATVEEIGLPCEMALRRGFEDVRDPQISVGEVTVRDTRATAQVRSSADGQEPSEDTIELVLVDGRWRIASLATD